MRAVIAGLFVLLAPAASFAQSSLQQDQIDAGKALSVKFCATCHVVVGANTGTDMAAPFATIAATRDDNYLHTFLMKPHGKMPPVDLTNDQIDQIVAYIESLKK